jgi:hypothetical protein
MSAQRANDEHKQQRPKVAEKMAGMPEVEALLVAVVRPAALDPEAERRALAAFRAARDEGLLTAPARRGGVRTCLRVRCRRRDDWRPEEARRRERRTAKAVIGGLAATVVLSGIAVAGGTVPSLFGSGVSGGPAQVPSGASSSGGPAPSGTPDAPGRLGVTRTPFASTGGPGDGVGNDEATLCRAYESDGGGEGPGKAFERLEAVAGGKGRVRAYCDRLLADAEEGDDGVEDGKGKDKGGTPTSAPEGKPTREPGRPQNSPAAADDDKAGSDDKEKERSGGKTDDG